MIFLDTSALLKRYVAEPGSDVVRRLMADDPDWAASALAWAETRVSLCHRGPEGILESAAQRMFALDWDRFHSVPVDVECLALAHKIGCGHALRTLDAIHLAAAMRLPDRISFLSFDQRQCDAARSLGLVVVPT